MRLFRNEAVRKYFLRNVLDITVESIRSVKLMNTFLGKRYREQKQGILDMLGTKNLGVLEAIRKAKRDQRAIEAYIREESMALGKAECDSKFLAIVKKDGL